MESGKIKEACDAMFQCVLMVRCTKCGSENPDDSRFCRNCGNALYPAAPGEPSQGRFERYERRRHERDMCFGKSAGFFWPIIIGVAVLLWGVSMIAETVYGTHIPWWPVIVIIVGALIIAQAVRRRM